MKQENIRNVAIIAHVDHGKTTIVDRLLYASGVFRENQQVDERVLDSNDQERERGITILSKNISVVYNDVKINVIDTPGHADFGGEVERVLNMADGALLIVDAFEGPMPQTRFVLRHALEQGLRIILVVNKIDRPGARPNEVVDEVFDLMVELEASDAQLDFPVVYASAMNGYARFAPDDDNMDMIPLLETILKEIPAPDCEPNGPVALQICTVDHSSFVGRIGVGRLFSGTIHKGEPSLVIKNDGTRYNTAIKQVFTFEELGKKERPEVHAGDIVAVVGLKDVSPGDTLCEEKHPIILESMEFADPVIDIAVEPKTKAEQDKMGIALQKLAEEDPTFRVSTNQETGQTIIAGMGELHLEIIVDRLLREFKVEANVGKPQVAYRETATQEARNVEGKFVRQSGGRGQYGHAVINLIPQEAGKGYEFENKIVGGVIPKEYITPIDKGIQEAINSGVLAGYPVVDIKIELIDGSYHDVDSSEAAFKVAGSMAVKAALKKAAPVILEPMMAVEVETPEEYMGDVMGNLSSRRGQIQGMGDRGNAKTIKAKVPLSEMFGYATDLRSTTQGRASYTMQFDSYEAVPKNVAEEIISKAGGNA